MYTCSTNGRDALRQDQCPSDANFVAYVDKSNNHTGLWERRIASDLFHSARRNARMHKILSHQFISAECSIWMDANVALRVPAQALIDAYLQSSDLAVFLHRTRACTYEEAKRCQELGLDASALIEDQVHNYQRKSLPTGLGLPETSVVIRRRSDRICDFNNAWWSELCRYSVRDQIGFMFAARRTGVKVNFITPTKYLNPYFSITNRPAGPEEITMTGTAQ